MLTEPVVLKKLRPAMADIAFAKTTREIKFTVGDLLESWKGGKLIEEPFTLSGKALLVIKQCKKSITSQHLVPFFINYNIIRLTS